MNYLQKDTLLRSTLFALLAVIVVLVTGCGIADTKKETCSNNSEKEIAGEFTRHIADHYIFETTNSTYNIYLPNNIKLKMLFNRQMDIDIVCKNNKWYLRNL